ncbi:chaplin [Streptomyces sp. NPDC006314]|uniref:chaplin n=1 Tax=Streptomyces sp. NPDC006314 TaxID=3154475 RepID=UPI0033ACE567
MTTLRQTLSRGVFAAAAATGILSLSCSSALADTNATGVTTDSPGVLAGNSVQVPIEAPVNVCGNSVNGVAAFNEAAGNSCGNGTPPSVSTPAPTPPPPTRTSETPPPTRTSHTPPPAVVEHPDEPRLAETGSKTMLATSAVSAALIAGGAMLYRRGRGASHR